MQTLTAGISNAQVAQPEGKLPAQAEKNPKQCGAIETVEAVTTRSGVNTAPVLKTPPMMPYVAPPRRTNQQSVTTEENAVEPQKEATSVENTSTAKTQEATVANPVPVVHKPVVQKNPIS